MRKHNLFIVAIIILSALVFSSCDRGDDLDPTNPIQKPAFTVLKEYMLENDLDLNYIQAGPDLHTKFVAGAPAEADLQAFLDKYTILDIRSAEAFASGHIEGAKHIAFSDILTEADNASKQILVVCFSGQTACYAVGILRLAGHGDAQALKWGMSGWNPETAGSWNNNTGDEASGHANWSYAAAPSNQTYEDPFIDMYEEDGSEVLRKQLEAVVAAGFGPVTAKGTDVLNKPQDYFVNNYFSDGDYGKFGHINEALRVKDELYLEGDGYKHLDSDDGAKVITYCYTGQTSAVTTAWLRVLGYDAYTMTFGMNGIYHSNAAWTTNQWGVGSSVPKNLPLVKS